MDLTPGRLLASRFPETLTLPLKRPAYPVVLLLLLSPYTAEPFVVKPTKPFPFVLSPRTPYPFGLSPFTPLPPSLKPQTPRVAPSPYMPTPLPMTPNLAVGFVVLPMPTFPPNGFSRRFLNATPDWPA